MRAAREFCVHDFESLFSSMQRRNREFPTVKWMGDCLLFGKFGHIVLQVSISYFGFEAQLIALQQIPVPTSYTSNMD